MTIVDRDLGAPLHHQIYLVLADGIATGRYAAGELLPTEEQLAQAVQRLAHHRAPRHGEPAECRPDRARRRPPHDRQAARQAAQDADGLGDLQHRRLRRPDRRQGVEFGYGPAPAFLRERLWEGEKPVQRAVRIRSQEGQPVMHLTSYVPETLGSTFSKAELDRIPMFKLLTRAGAHISAGEQIVSATLADPVVAQRLEIKVGAALIDLRTMMVDQQGRAVEYVEMLAPPERLSLRFELGAEQFVSVSPKPRRRSS